MGKLSVKRRLSISPQVGDMRDRIGLYTRDIQAPSFRSSSFGQTYTLIAEVWSNLVTVEGPEVFDDVNTQKVITDIFTIRYRDDITSEVMVKFDGDNYEIIRPLDPNKRKRFLQLRCRLLGADTLEANK